VQDANVRKRIGIQLSMINRFIVDFPQYVMLMDDIVTKGERETSYPKKSEPGWDKKVVFPKRPFLIPNIPNLSQIYPN